MYPSVHCGTTHNSQDMSIDGGTDKEDVYIYNGILLSHKKIERKKIRLCHLKRHEWT